MPQHLPAFIDPWRFADLGKKISGSFSHSEFEGLQEIILDAQGEASFEFEFFRDSNRRACMKGFVRTTLLLQCQRCLDSLSLPVDSNVSVGFVHSLEEAEGLPDDLDPELVEDALVNLIALVEAELLLAIPQVPMHPADACAVDMDGYGNVSIDNAENGSISPFAVLADLKIDKR